MDDLAEKAEDLQEAAAKFDFTKAVPQEITEEDQSITAFNQKPLKKLEKKKKSKGTCKRVELDCNSSKNTSPSPLVHAAQTFHKVAALHAGKEEVFDTRETNTMSAFFHAAPSLDATPAAVDALSSAASLAPKLATAADKSVAPEPVGKEVFHWLEAQSSSEEEIAMTSLCSLISHQDDGKTDFPRVYRNGMSAEEPFSHPDIPEQSNYYQLQGRTKTGTEQAKNRATFSSQAYMLHMYMHGNQKGKERQNRLIAAVSNSSTTVASGYLLCQTRES